jgi:hypothetical protein
LDMMTPRLPPLFSLSTLSQPGQASFIGENEGLAEASVRLKTSKTQLTKKWMIQRSIIKIELFGLTVFKDKKLNLKIDSWQILFNIDPLTIQASYWQVIKTLRGTRTNSFSSVVTRKLFLPTRKPNLTQVFKLIMAFCYYTNNMP